MRSDFSEDAEVSEKLMLRNLHAGGWRAENDLIFTQKSFTLSPVNCKWQMGENATWSARAKKKTLTLWSPASQGKYQ